MECQLCSCAVGWVKFSEWKIIYVKDPKLTNFKFFEIEWFCENPKNSCTFKIYIYTVYVYIYVLRGLGIEIF